MHSPEQKRKKEDARAESMDHMHNANVMAPRGGMDHEDHKEMEHMEKMEEAKEHGVKVKIGQS
jgi:hypothetical protein